MRRDRRSHAYSVSHNITVGQDTLHNGARGGRGCLGRRASPLVRRPFGISIAFATLARPEVGRDRYSSLLAQRVRAAPAASPKLCLTFIRVPGSFFVGMSPKGAVWPPLFEALGPPFLRRPMRRKWRWTRKRSRRPPKATLGSLIAVRPGIALQLRTKMARRERREHSRQ